MKGMESRKMAAMLGMKPEHYAEGGVADSKEEAGESPMEAAVEDVIDCLGVDPAKVDKAGLTSALHAFVAAVMESQRGEE